MRLLVQSCDTGRFLVPDLEGGAEWVPSLRDAGAGVLDDVEHALQVAQEWAELGERVQLVDLDRLDTVDDYLGGVDFPAAGALPAHPDGNYGENKF